MGALHLIINNMMHDLDYFIINIYFVIHVDALLYLVSCTMEKMALFCEKAVLVKIYDHPCAINTKACGCVVDV